MSGFKIRPLIALGILCLSTISSVPGDELSAPKPLLEFGDRPKTIVCLGDSVTGVYYHTGGLRAYPEMLELALRKAVPGAMVRVVNAGISGHATNQGLARLDRDVLSKQPDLVTVSFGLNDLTRIPPEQFRTNLEEIVTRCRAANSQVLLCTPNAVVETSARPREKVSQYSDLIRAAGRDLGVPVCDQYRAGEALRARDPWIWRLTMSDEIHPNMAGHRRMAQELCRSITGKDVSLADEAPAGDPLSRTWGLVGRKQPVKILAMPPLDALIMPALQSCAAEVTVEVTRWPSEGTSIGELEAFAKERVRAMKPDLVLIAVPRSAGGASDEQFVRSFSWIMNWSLSFGHKEWDCIVVHPSVTAPDVDGPRDDLVRSLVLAQDLHLVDRASGDTSSAGEILASWLKKHRASRD